MHALTKSALGLCCAALGISQVFAAGTRKIDTTCDSEKPVIMLVAGRTLDAERTRDYAIASGSSHLYPQRSGLLPQYPPSDADPRGRAGRLRRGIDGAFPF